VSCAFSGETSGYIENAENEGERDREAETQRETTREWVKERETKKVREKNYGLAHERNEEPPFLPSFFNELFVMFL